ncbi:MAG: hypothetical protein NTV86_06020, partial [Planctomycetota bacterium]|nr:hypothetical protein [Planctomycetota bacterium]
MTRSLCLLIGAMLIAGCRPAAEKPAPAADREIDLGVIETLGESDLADYTGRRIVLILPAGEHSAFAAKLAAENEPVLHNLLFDLAAAEDLDPSDEDAVAQFVRDWIHERYYGGADRPVRRVELRQD